MLFLTVFLFDLSLLILCITLVKKQGTWTFLHPATIYFGFHILIVTLRVFAILNGAPTLFDEPLYVNLGFSPITQDEIIRATLFADLALFASTLAFMKAYEDHNRRQQQNVSVKGVSREILLQKNRVYPVLVLTGIVGIVGFVVISYLPGSSTRLVESFELGEWGSSSWIFITQFWLASVLIGLIFVRGFSRFLLLFFVIYLILQLFQGFHRFRLVLPVVMLINIYVLRNRLRWPPKWIIFLGLIGMVLFLPAKKIGTMLIAGEPIDNIVNATTEYLVTLPTQSTSDLVLLDQFAASLTLEDEHGQYYWGASYLPILTLPIPRQWWPEKPGIAFYLREIQTPQRPMAQLGAIVTLAGESYINFGIIGVIIIPALYAYIMTRIYFNVKDHSYFAVGWLAYLMLNIATIQVYRDGLPSVVLFTAVSFMPLAIIVLHHWVFPPKFTQESNNTMTVGLSFENQAKK